MNQIVFTAWVLLFPAACTTLGAAGVFLLRRRSRPCTQRILCGMAAGIMLAASVWSLLLPAIQRGQTLPLPAWIPSAVGLVLGAGGFAGAAHAGKQVGMAHTVCRDLVFQRSNNGPLAYHILKTLRSPFAVQGTVHGSLPFPAK